MLRKYSGCALAVFLAVVLWGGIPAISAQTPTPTPTPDQKQAKKKGRKIDESSTGAPRGQTGITLEGIVVNPDGKPAEAAQVVLTSGDDPTQRWTAKSDSTGRFQFEVVLPPGNYLATASTKSWVSDVYKVSVPPEKSAPLRLKLRPHSESDQKK